MKDYNQIVLTVDRFRKFSDDLQVQRQLLWDTANKLMNLLVAIEYICVIYEDETDILVIEYQHNERFNPLGVANPVWMTEEDLEDFSFYKEEQKSSKQENYEE